MEVNCHGCTQIINTESDVRLCNYCLTNLLCSYRPGELYVDIIGTTWIRMEDNIDKHLEDFFFNPRTGEYKHASRIVYRTCNSHIYKEVNKSVREIKEVFDQALKLSSGESILMEFHTPQELESFRVQIARNKVSCRKFLGSIADEIVIRKNTRAGRLLLFIEKLPINPTITLKSSSIKPIPVDPAKERLRKLMAADGCSAAEIEEAMK